MLAPLIRRLYSTATKPRKRFYKNVTLSKIDDRLSEVHLDGRSVKTPMGKPLRMENEPLAVAIAQEWECQKEWIRPNRMHLTALAMTAFENPIGQTKERLIEHIVQVFETDTVLYLEDNSAELAKLQTERWGEVINWTNSHLGVDIKASSNLAGPGISPEARQGLIRFLSIYNEPALQGFIFGSDTLKSVILALAAVQGRLSVQEAVKLSVLEQEFQTEHWGRVEWAHDVEYHDSCGRLAAAVLFVQLNSTRTSHIAGEKR